MAETDFRALAEELARQLSHFGGPGPREVDRILRGEMMTLGYLITNEDVHPGDLVAFSNASSAHVAQTLQRLEAKGEIVRAMDPQDRRRTLVLLTDAGRARMEEAWESALHYIQASLKALGADDARNLVRIVGRVADWAQSQPE